MTELTSARPPIPVGVRLPLPTEALTPLDQVTLCRHAMDLGFSSFWVGDHVVLPAQSNSAYPHTADGKPGFRPDTPWTDPFIHLTWLAAQLPEARFGTSILVMTLRNPTLLAKQLASMSWLTRQPFSLGVGSGWLRDEYDAIGATFEKRGTRARHEIAQIKELITTGRAQYTVRGDDDELVEKEFVMLPTAPAPVEFLWGGLSPLALKMVARSCDGWLPAKQSLDALEGHLGRLRATCDEVGRNFSELKLVVKPGSGPDPASGAIDRDNLAGYAELGFHEAVLEMPYEPDSLGEAIDVLERVAARGWA